MTTPKIVFEYLDAYLTQLIISNSKIISLIDKCVEDLYELDYLEYEPPIVVFGKKVNQHRNLCFISDVSEGYKYSGQMAKSKPMTDSFNKLMRKVNKIYNAEYNGILINEYTDGTKTIGKHSDDVRNLDKNAGVVSLSIGASRKFRIRQKGKVLGDDDKHHESPILYDHITQNYELLQMGGTFQEYLTHEIPKETKVKTSRISFTFLSHSS